MDPHPGRGLVAIEHDRREALLPRRGQLRAQIQLAEFARQALFQPGDHGFQPRIRLAGEGDPLAEEVDPRRGSSSRNRSTPSPTGSSYPRSTGARPHGRPHPPSRSSTPRPPTFCAAIVAWTGIVIVNRSPLPPKTSGPRTTSPTTRQLRLGMIFSLPIPRSTRFGGYAGVDMLVDAPELPRGLLLDRGLDIVQRRGDRQRRSSMSATENRARRRPWAVPAN